MIDVPAPPHGLAMDPWIDGPDGSRSEGAIYRYDRSGHDLLRVVPAVDEATRFAFAHDPVDLALVVDGPLLVLGSRVGEALSWAGASFHWHRVRRPERVLPPRGAETVEGARLDLMLLEAGDSRARAVRPLTLPVDFSRVLHEAILDQARYTYDPGGERRALENLLRRCPGPASLLAYSTVRATITG